MGARAIARRVRAEVLSRENATPLDVLMDLATDEQQPAPLRAQCAAWAAPYVFPRLSAAVVATAPLTAKDDTTALVARIYDRFQRLADATPVLDAISEPVAA